VEEIRKGLWPAVAEFLENHPEWSLRERFVNNNGLTVLEKSSQDSEVVVPVIAANSAVED
jgi:hypothetical protein